LAEQGKDKSIKALKDFLRPEFINRVDEIVYFNRLSEENFVSIAKLMLEELHTVMTEKKIEFNYDDALLQYLAKKSYSLTYGARNLRRLIQKEIEDCVATEIIDNFRGKVSSISLTAKDEKVQITVA
ncbi:MAG: ATP-dependent Clp protease ATP-binding subunit, partial [Oscillospiraceae bacterium]